MSKKQFCDLLFEYIKDDFTKVDIDLENESYGFDFNKDDLVLRKDYFLIQRPGCPSFKIHYEEVKGISL